MTTDMASLNPSARKNALAGRYPASTWFDTPGRPGGADSQCRADYR
jgi:hypothetical protein